MCSTLARSIVSANRLHHLMKCVMPSSDIGNGISKSRHDIVILRFLSTVTLLQMVKTCEVMLQFVFERINTTINTTTLNKHKDSVTCFK